MVRREIEKACTLPAEFYRCPDTFQRLKESLFARSWHYVTEAENLREPGSVFPFTLLEGVLDEPLVLTRDREGQLHCLSNVCTHRGKIIVEQAGRARQLTCGYHGRCFHLDGRFKSMPCFNGVENFPTENDDLTRVEVREWNGLLFVALDPEIPFETWMRPVDERLAGLPLHTLRPLPEHHRDYPVRAHWALYCDNYLEGFHIPFVHPALNKALDFPSYDYELFDWGNLQLGIAAEGEPCFELPPGSPDAGKQVFAYYFWLFPNLMLNFYPWGLSLNYVQPLAPDATCVRFRSFGFEGVALSPETSNLHQTELEDEAVVESVQKGIRSRFYRSGRFSPSQEKGVHQFHYLLSERL